MRPRRGPASRRVVALLAGVAVAALAADVITKIIVVAQLRPADPVRLLGGLVYLSLTRNRGAAFNIGGTGYTAVLAAVAVVVIIVIIRFARRLRSRPWAVALGLVLGGAAGNLVDRLFREPGPLRGAVVDFISLFGPYGHPWPIFNVADSCLVVGVILAVLLELTGRRMDGGRSGRSATDDAPGDAPDDGEPNGDRDGTTSASDRADPGADGAGRAGTDGVAESDGGRGPVPEPGANDDDGAVRSTANGAERAAADGARDRAVPAAGDGGTGRSGAGRPERPA